MPSPSLLISLSPQTQVTRNLCRSGKRLSAHEKDKLRALTSFRDTSLHDSLFFLDLLYAVSPTAVDWRVVCTPTATKQALSGADALLNARYTLSAARKLGCAVFCMPADLVHVRPKMMLTLCAAIMAVAIEREG